MLRLILAAIFIVALVECDPSPYEEANGYGDTSSLKEQILKDMFGESYSSKSKPTYPPSPRQYQPRYYPSPRPSYPPSSYRDYSPKLPTSEPRLYQYSTTNPITGDYKIVERGQRNTDSYRIFLANSKGEIISPWHDVPLYADQAANILNVVVEIPRWINAKYEITKNEKFNPINQQLTTDNKLRFYFNVLPFHGYIKNYGSLPQTYTGQDPNGKIDPLGYPGDDDLVDVLEIGSKIHPSGSVIKVKILGSLGFVDGGRLQGEPKIVAIDITDPIAWKLNDINDVETHLPGLLEYLKDWFRIYKVPNGDPVNFFTNNGNYYDRATTLNIIARLHSRWRDLITGVISNPTNNALVHTTAITGSSNQKTASEASNTVTTNTRELSALDGPLNQAELEKVAYVDRTKLSN